MSRGVLLALAAVLAANGCRYDDGEDANTAAETGTAACAPATDDGFSDGDDVDGFDDDGDDGLQDGRDFGYGRNDDDLLADDPCLFADDRGGDATIDDVLGRDDDDVFGDDDDEA